jgi:uncharacterized protein (UPF0276 family)
VTKVGVGYRWPLADWIDTRPCQCLEITAEHFYERDESRLAALAEHFELYVHGLGLSLGTPGDLDEARLARFARVVEIARPAWISEHVAFTRTTEADLGHLNPIRPTRDAVRTMARHAREVAERCGRPIILENITSHLRIEGELSETDFLNEVCRDADCGLLLDITNLFINSRNHGFDPFAWFRELDPACIRQLHIVGYSVEHGRFTDGHGEPVQEELLELAAAVIAAAPVRAIILERDEDFPGAAQMEAELAKLRRVCGGA